MYKKAVRRDTVYIPPDDTTVATVFMGMFSPLKKNPNDIPVVDDDETQEINSLEAQIMRKRLAKEVKKKQQQQTSPKQENGDIFEKGNIPHGGEDGGRGGGMELPAYMPPGLPPSSRLLPPPVKKRPVLINRRDTNLQRSGDAGMAKGKTSFPARSSNLLNKKYPLLTEDISNPAMYEDNWLFHQEIVITQLVNGLLLSAHDDDDDDDNNNNNNLNPNPDTLRNKLLAIYQTDYFMHLHERLQASLQCGSLRCIPKYSQGNNNNRRNDVGFRKKFMDMWVPVYDRAALRAAAETIVGRRLQVQPTKRKIEEFLDTMLLQQNDDTDSWEEYARTVLRSIMMIILLDKGACSGALLSGGRRRRRLFVKSSPYKSSEAVLQAVGQLLLPSCGDMTRTLGHLGCEVGYQQHPLQEYNYHIDNLAIDLRDGIRLGRIVEILLYPFPHDKPLSQRVKVPCISRATKLFNVRIVLQALASKGGAVDNVRPEDIVDGHREKSMALLWWLVSGCGWGLAGLVDRHDLRSEIDRLESKRRPGSSRGQDENEERQLLVRWASILAETKGLHLENLSTSFADGRIYESIVDEYEGYLNNNGRVGTGTNWTTLETRLESLGCSSQFGGI